MGNCEFESSNSNINMKNDIKTDFVHMRPITIKTHMVCINLLLIKCREEINDIADSGHVPGIEHHYKI